MASATEASAASTGSALGPGLGLGSRAIGALRELRGDAGEGLRERVSEVTEDVGRVVELDQLVRGRQLAPRAVAVLGEDLRAELAGGAEDEPLVVVVDDDQVAQLVHQPRGRLLELVEQAGLAGLAPLLEVEREVVQRERRALLVVRVEHRRLPGGPRVGRAGVAVVDAQAERLLGRHAGRPQQVVGRGRLGGEARGLAGRLGERGEHLGRVVQLDQLRRVVDDLGIGHPLAGVRVLVSAADAERGVGRDREVVGIVVDQRQPAELGDPVAVAVQELGQLLRGLDDEIGPLEGGVVGDLAQQVVAAQVHSIASFSRGIRGLVRDAPAGTSSGGVRRSIPRPGGRALASPRPPRGGRASRSRAGRAG